MHSFTAYFPRQDTLNLVGKLHLLWKLHSAYVTNQNFGDEQSIQNHKCEERCVID
jgi:hypothetical protein